MVLSPSLATGLEIITLNECDIPEMEALYEQRRVTEREIAALLTGDRAMLENFWRRGGFLSPFADYERGRLHQLFHGEVEEEMHGVGFREEGRLLAYGWYTFPARPEVLETADVELETTAELEMICSSVRGLAGDILTRLHAHLDREIGTLVSYYKHSEIVVVGNRMRPAPSVPNIASEKLLRSFGYEKKMQMLGDLAYEKDAIRIYPVWQRVVAKR